MKYSVLAVALLLGACGGGGGSSTVVDPAGNTSTGSTASLTATIEALSQVNKGEITRFTANDISGATYDWSMIGHPNEFAPAMSANGRVAEIAGTAPGDYTIQLVVSSGDQSSDPVTATTTIIDAGDAPVRPLHELDHATLLAFAEIDIERKLRSPSSYQVIGNPTYLTYENIGTPDKGSLTINFDADNAFGATLRYRALCPIEWLASGGYWKNTLTFTDTSLDVCFIID